MPSKTVKSHPNNARIFVSCEDRLNLWEIAEPQGVSAESSNHHQTFHRRAVVRGSRPLSGLTSLDWCADAACPKVMGFGTNKGDVFILNWDRSSEVSLMEVRV